MALPHQIAKWQRMALVHQVAKLQRMALPSETLHQTAISHA
jgi:hypothetical protein